MLHVSRWERILPGGNCITISDRATVRFVDAYFSASAIRGKIFSDLFSFMLCLCSGRSSVCPCFDDLPNFRILWISDMIVCHSCFLEKVSYESGLKVRQGCYYDAL